MVTTATVTAPIVPAKPAKHATIHARAAPAMVRADAIPRAIPALSASASWSAPESSRVDLWGNGADVFGSVAPNATLQLSYVYDFSLAANCSRKCFNLGLMTT